MQERVDLREGWGLSVPSRWLRLCCRQGRLLPGTVPREDVWAGRGWEHP